MLFCCPLQARIKAKPLQRITYTQAAPKVLNGYHIATNNFSQAQTAVFQPTQFQQYTTAPSAAAAAAAAQAVAAQQQPLNGIIQQQQYTYYPAANVPPQWSQTYYEAPQAMVSSHLVGKGSSHSRFLKGLKIMQ